MPVVTDLQDNVSYLGTIHGQHEVQLLAQVQATVLSLPRREGETVRAGDVVATLASPELQATVERLAAERDYWCRHYEADERLVEAGALPREQADASLRACRSATAAVAEAEARLAKTTERAPIDSRVLAWWSEPGQHVMPGQPLVLLGSDSLEVHVEVVESDLARGIDVGTAVHFRTHTGSTFRSSVVEVAPAASGRSRTFTVVAPLPAELSQTMRVGSSLRLDFVLSSCSECVAVPIEAIHRASGDSYVFEFRDHRVLKRRVRTGITEGNFVQVSLSSQDILPVAISNLTALADSTRVFAVSTKAPTP